jgi:2-C-methyl-D-erythritol 2,4-cyclodiphosphate synthase
MHAVIDALLGALAWGDIGEWFPDTDPQYQKANSGALLSQVVDKMQSDGWRIVNLDCIIFAQRPKLTPIKKSIRDRLAAILSLDMECVSVKAKTGEAVGPIGREEAISAEAVVLLQRD